MKIVIVTGAAGLIGSQAVEFFVNKGFRVVGIDNDLRRYFFGEEASTDECRKSLEKQFKNYVHKNVDIRNTADLEKIFKDYNKDIDLIIHTAAQPSHDWAAKEPMTDFQVNANGTLNLLEMTRVYCPKASFIFTSTNKVYGDLPNQLPLEEGESRWDLPHDHLLYEGIDESMSIDQSKHSLFGVSKLAADVLVQEYGRYFGLKTVSFRGGCLTGPRHCGAKLHGFLSYLMKCCIKGDSYTILGYKGKQVRDNIHSYDLVNAFYCYYQNPRSGEVYNIGGGRSNSCSVLEAITLCESIVGKRLDHHYLDQNRVGDHIWYITNLKKFQSHYPNWTLKYNLKETLIEMFQFNR